MYTIKNLPSNQYGPAATMSLLIGLKVNAERFADKVVVKVHEIVASFRREQRNDAAEFFGQSTSSYEFNPTDCVEE